MKTSNTTPIKNSHEESKPEKKSKSSFTFITNLGKKIHNTFFPKTNTQRTEEPLHSSDNNNSNLAASGDNKFSVGVINEKDEAEVFSRADGDYSSSFSDSEKDLSFVEQEVDYTRGRRNVEETYLLDTPRGGIHDCNFENWAENTRTSHVSALNESRSSNDRKINTRM